MDHAPHNPAESPGDPLRGPARATRNAGPPDRALIEGCLRHDHRAWGDFVDRYGRLVYAIPSRMRLPPDACDDIFQNVFAIVLRELPGIRDYASLPKWLMTVAHHESYRWIRQARAAEAATGAPLPDIGPEPVGEELLRLEQRHIIQRGIEQLGDRCRELLTALFLEHPGGGGSSPSYQEISERLGMPIGAIGPTRNRCLRKLLDLIGDQLE